MTPKIHGIALSNYTNMVKTAILEKDLAVEFIDTPPSQDDGFLALSPMGKVPVLETPHGPITESQAIFQFLEASYPKPSLSYPEPYQASKVREFCLASINYLEPVVKQGYGVLFGGEVSEETGAQIAKDLPKPVTALKRLTDFSPWAIGDQFTYADITLFWILALAVPAVKKTANVDLLAELGAARWFDQMESRPSIRSLRNAESAFRKERGLSS